MPADPEAQIRQVFRNIAATLAEAGVDWSDVVEINSYHVGLQNQTETVLKVAAEFLDAPYPAWTAVGISELIYPEAIVEISCVAIIPDSK
jgi:enamine deaminase RidA (YjgF/YER057c/UK114 family)